MTPPSFLTMSFSNVLIFIILFSSFFPFCAAADGDGVAGSSSLAALLGPLLAAAAVNTSGAGSFPWHHTHVEVIKTSRFLFKSFLLHEIPGLVMQARNALFQNVSGVTIRLCKIPGMDITWRAFVCSDADLDPSNFSTTSLVDFVCNHPGAVPVFTLDKDTTQSSIDIPITWLNGLGTSVTSVLPPLHVPRLVVYATTTGSFKDKTLTIAISGTVNISGYGYVAGHVSGEGASST